MTKPYWLVLHINTLTTTCLHYSPSTSLTWRAITYMLWIWHKFHFILIGTLFFSFCKCEMIPLGKDFKLLYRIARVIICQLYMNKIALEKLICQFISAFKSVNFNQCRADWLETQSFLSLYNGVLIIFLGSILTPQHFTRISVEIQKKPNWHFRWQKTELSMPNKQLAVLTREMKHLLKYQIVIFISQILSLVSKYVGI